MASPVQFVKGLRTLYEAGARVFVEVGPKKALHGFVEDVLGDAVLSLFTNHPKIGDIPAFNQALCGLYAAGLGAAGKVPHDRAPVKIAAADPAPAVVPAPPAAAPGQEDNRYLALGRLFADFLDRGCEIWEGEKPAPAARPVEDTPVVITGAALGLPGTERIFDDANVARILRGEQFIGAIPPPLRRAMVDKNITRLVKTGNGGPSFETIDNPADVIKLAARGGSFDPEQDFGFPDDRLAALDRVTRLAIAAGIDALRDAGIPLVMRYKTTTKGTQLPDRWGLPDAIRDDTGIIFASASPATTPSPRKYRAITRTATRREQSGCWRACAPAVVANTGDGALALEMDRRMEELRAEIEEEPYNFDRRFLLPGPAHGPFAICRIHRRARSQHATNAACASGTQAVALAEDWIRTGRCRRVIIVSADDITSDNLMGWFGSGFLASGAAATG